ncbi:MAG: response regulator [Alphaproteobacteria bacterium]|nr:response regulator [Alphaproteobacteria bacterium]
MKTCLLVDDSRVIRKVARQIFEASGFSCEEAEDGKVALESCQKKLPDVILLDWNMPVMDGLQFLKALRLLPGGDAPAVVFCTTENDMNHIQEALATGANEYIMKPFDADIVRSKLYQLGLIESQ